MDRSHLLAVALAGAVAVVTPAAAQPTQANPTQANVADMQRALSQRGFSPGRVDGRWGPDTEAALRRFQAANHLPTTGNADGTTLQALGTAQGASSPVLAQNTPPSGAVSSGTSAPGTPQSTAAAPPAVAPPVAPVAAPGATPPAPPPSSDAARGTATSGSTAPGSNAGVNAASGNNNQAIATTDANAPQPAHGANSFSQGEAQRRIAHAGFGNVSGLRKDNNGVWRGTGTRNGQQVSVWLDYKGNVGQQ